MFTPHHVANVSFHMAHVTFFSSMLRFYLPEGLLSTKPTPSSLLSSGNEIYLSEYRIDKYSMSEAYMFSSICFYFRGPKEEIELCTTSEQEQALLGSRLVSTLLG